MAAHQQQPEPCDNDEIISYQKLRAFIGFIGLLLPVAVVAGCFVFGAKEYSWQHSISHYYYSKMHIVFVCTLCVLGGFLITYKGKNDVWESRISNIAGYCAFGIASFPTMFAGFRSPKNGTNQYIEILGGDISEFWNGVHFGFAGALFTCFVIFCLYFFQKPDDKYTGAALLKFKRRKRIYKVCGWGILISIIMIVLFNFVPPFKGTFAYSTFTFETTALCFFGTAWLIKGSLALKKIPVLKTMINPIR